MERKNYNGSVVTSTGVAFTGRPYIEVDGDLFVGPVRGSVADKIRSTKNSRSSETREQ